MDGIPIYVDGQLIDPSKLLSYRGNGGDGGNRTRVRKTSAFSSTCLFHLLL